VNVPKIHVTCHVALQVARSVLWGVWVAHNPGILKIVGFDKFLPVVDWWSGSIARHPPQPSARLFLIFDHCCWSALSKIMGVLQGGCATIALWDIADFRKMFSDFPHLTGNQPAYWTQIPRMFFIVHVFPTELYYLFRAKWHPGKKQPGRNVGGVFTSKKTQDILWIKQSSKKDPRRTLSESICHMLLLFSDERPTSQFSFSPLNLLLLMYSCLGRKNMYSAENYRQKSGSYYLVFQ